MDEKKYKILFADDEYWTREKMRKMIQWEKYGLEFLEPAVDGEEVLQKMEDSQPDILITDINMPFLNGVELLEQVHARFPDVVTFVISGYDDFEYVKGTFMSGAMNYLKKPIAKVELVNAIARALEAISEREQEKRQLLNAASLIQDREFSQMIQRDRRSFVPAVSVNGKAPFSGMSLVLVKIHNLSESVHKNYQDLARFSYHFPGQPLPVPGGGRPWADAAAQAPQRLEPGRQAGEYPLEDLQLEPAWDPHAVRCEKFGQAGSMPVNKFFPFAAVEDRRSGVFWGAQLACPASWQMELYRKDDALALSGGLADRDFGHWMKDLHPGESFLTPEAIVSTAHTPSIDVFTARLTQAALEHLAHVPEPEQSLPIIFNEYCTTWGSPSHANICEILGAIQGKGFQYFVIDCGWYKEDGVPWDISMGDYEPSPTLFPQGLDKTTAKIREAGMIPGIWFEIETVGKAARAYQLEPHLLHKDGKPLTSYFRRFWDMRDPWVEEYLTQKVICTLQKYGFGYLKIDYNETIGIGCDGAESLGEALRQNMEASQAFFEKIKRNIPGIVLENCASGGHRLEPGLMSQMSMASFSDAHECPEIPVIAANLHRAVHPAQSQIWAVIRQADSQQRIAYSIANTFLGRMCISGDVTGLTQAQWDVIERGMEFYRKIAPIIKQGQSYRFGSRIKSARHPEGWQALLRIGQGQEAYMVIHTFANAALPLEIQIPLPEGCPAKVLEIYSDTQEQIEIQDGILSYQARHSWKAVAVRLNP